MGPLARDTLPLRSTFRSHPVEGAIKQCTTRRPVDGIGTDPSSPPVVRERAKPSNASLRGKSVHPSGDL